VVETIELDEARLVVSAGRSAGMMDIASQKVGWYRRTRADRHVSGRLAARIHTADSAALHAPCAQI
jgi:hypothetical protein